MHSYKTPNMTFFYNSDYSGDVLIDSHTFDYGIVDERNSKFKIPMCELLDFVAGMMRQKRISDLEQTNTKELLQL